MHGGSRKGAGRKSISNKRKAYTIYLSDEDSERIESLPLPNSLTFSQKCRELIGIGIKEVEQKFVRNKGEVTFIDLFSGLGGIQNWLWASIAGKWIDWKMCVF